MINKIYNIVSSSKLQNYALICICILAIVYPIESKSMPDVSKAFGDVEFQTTKLKPLKLNSFEGKVIVLFFGYTHCPDICPTALLDISKTLKELGRDAAHVQPIFISVDYKRDNPEILEQYVKFFDERIIGLSSNKLNIDKISKYFKINYSLLDSQSENYLVEHSSNLYVIDKNLIVKKIIPNGLPSTEITKAIKKLIN
jgi:protein SCO1